MNHVYLMSVPLMSVFHCKPLVVVTLVPTEPNPYHFARGYFYQSSACDWRVSKLSTPTSWVCNLPWVTNYVVVRPKK